MGIQPTNAGIDFQHRASALMMILMEFEINFDMLFNVDLKERVSQLHFESSDKIDDLVIETTSCRKVYMQMKRNISFSEEKNSEFYGVCKQFVKQFCQGNLNDVAYILITRTQASSRITIKLKRILDGIRLANTIEIKENLNKEEIDILDKFKRTIKIIYKENMGKSINNETLKEFLCKIHIEALDIEDGESFEKNVKLILYSKISIDVNLFWNMLISMAAKYAANRRSLEKSYLHKKIKEYIVSFESCEGNGKLLKSIWDLNKSDIMVQKDYVVAFQKDSSMKIDEKKQIFIMEFFRFKDEEKKPFPQYIAPNIMKTASDLEFEILFRCSSKSRLEEYIDTELEKITNENTEIIFIPVKGDFKEEAVEIAHKELLKNCIDTQEECKCINCGKAIFEKEVYVVEIDNVECSHKSGMIHKECLRPIDRVLGIAKMPNTEKYNYLKNFDVALWIKLLLNGKQAWGNIEGFNNSIQNMVIDSDEVFHDGKYCLKTILSNGTTRYTTNRGVVDRLSKNSAESLANKFNKLYKKAHEDNNPICYTSETFVYGPYEQLLVQMGEKEELLECELTEVALYNETIAKLYNDCKTFYAPIIYLTVEGEPLILDGIFPLITNPLNLNIYLENWKTAGITISNYEVNIIEDDNDFILKIISLITNGIRPIVNMFIGKNKKMLKGCIISLMNELEPINEKRPDAECPPNYTD